MYYLSWILVATVKNIFFLLLMKTKEKHNLETAVEESEVSNVAYASLLFSSVKERKCFHSGNYSNKWTKYQIINFNANQNRNSAD